MTPDARKLLNEVLGLPEEDRVRIATEVLASLDVPSNACWGEAWAGELERRLIGATNRSDAASEWRQVRGRVLDRLEDRAEPDQP